MGSGDASRTADGEARRAAARLPEVLPIFPLTGALLLPGGFLPLNIFEPRYRTLVEEAWEGARIIGMVQPLVPRDDDRGPVAGSDPSPSLYEVGCAGAIGECSPQADGRYLIVLRGLCRFRIDGEPQSGRPYRMVRARYREFLGDLVPPPEEAPPAELLAALATFGDRLALQLDLDMLGSLPRATLVNSLCAALPFAPAEKQALLEAGGGGSREEILFRLLEMGSIRPRGGAGRPEPTVH